MEIKRPDSFTWKYTEDSKNNVHKLEVQDTYLKITDEEFDAIVEELRQQGAKFTISGRTLNTQVDMPEGNVLAQMLWYALVNLSVQLPEKNVREYINVMLDKIKKGGIGNGN